MKFKKLYVIICRLQPKHIGHDYMITTTLQLAKENGGCVLILIGSANKSRTLENPYTYEERLEMFEGMYDNEDLIIAPLMDYDYEEELWEEELHDTIKYVIKDNEFLDNNADVSIVTSNKGGDDILRNSWSRGLDVISLNRPLTVFVGGGTKTLQLSATKIRSDILTTGIWSVKHLVSKQTFKTMFDFKSIFNYIEDEMIYIDEYRNLWKSSAYPVQFSTTDIIVRDKNDKILLVKRGGKLGKGQLAMPGGFVEGGLTYVENAKKELLEETGLNLDNTNYVMVRQWFCDSVNRSPLGRITTMVYLVDVLGEFIEVDGELFLNKGNGDEVKSIKLECGDDAVGLAIHSYNELKTIDMFYDHFGLISKIINNK